METIKILVVDDEMLSIITIIEQLKGTRYEVEYETKAEKALNKLKENSNYALVLVDRMMFGMDGMALLKEMKQDLKLKTIPFIMQTGEAEPEEIEAALLAGAEKVILKPIQKEDLMKLLDEFSLRQTS